MINAEIIADSIGENGVRLTTFSLVMHRFVLSEFNTHRMFSRNSASSRAIPIEKMIDRVLEAPAIPVEIGKNQKGMQAKELLDEENANQALQAWLLARDEAVRHARVLLRLGVHKQLANRIMEPWMFTSTVVTATDWDNFFYLRCSPEAQPEIRVLAEKMRGLYFSNTPLMVGIDGWHLPFIKESDRHKTSSMDDLIKASVARCARVSYLTHDKKEPDLQADVQLHDRLLASKHLSPFEHVARPTGVSDRYIGNFKGWEQYRKTIKDECYTNYTPPK